MERRLLNLLLFAVLFSTALHAQSTPVRVILSDVTVQCSAPDCTLVAAASGSFTGAFELRASIDENGAMTSGTWSLTAVTSDRTLGRLTGTIASGSARVGETGATTTLHDVVLLFTQGSDELAALPLLNGNLTVSGSAGELLLQYREP